MAAPKIFPWARESAGPSPLRRPGSVRRTTTIDTHWPGDPGEHSVMEGKARDIITPQDGGAPRVLTEGSYTITCSPIREILDIRVSPDHANAQKMVGIRAGGDSRVALGNVMGDIRGTPLYQVMDDFAGASLVSGFVWSCWVEDWTELMRKRFDGKAGGAPFRRSMVNICTGFSEGASSLTAEGVPDSVNQNRTEVGPLENPQDPEGWHALRDQTGPEARRARRIDVWREDGLIHVDASFQDSGRNPQGGRTAIHEYQLAATVDPTDMTVVSLVATPRILPYRECPGATENLKLLVGGPVGNLRQDVLDTLPGALGCTHLNDVVRALADVAVLAEHLPAAQSRTA